MLEEMAPTPGAWDPSLLIPVVEINERLLEGMREAALEQRAEAAPLLAQLQSEWRLMDVLAQRRLARCPYLLLDAGFGDARRWHCAGALAVHECPEPADVALASAPGYLVVRGWRALVRRTMVLGWHLARASPVVARVLLGMPTETAQRIATIPLSELDALAEQAGTWVAPRWQGQPGVWRQLLRASRASDAQLLTTQLRGLQLLASAAAWPQLRAGQL
jgi:hypothetical protein